MPVADSEAQVIFQPAAVNHAVLVVPAEGGRISRILAGEGYGRACIEEFG
jgi:hypothetical protein